MNKMNLATATAKADKVKSEIAVYEKMRDYYLKSVSIAEKFEGKVLNARFTTALNENLNDTNARFVLNGNSMMMNAFEFKVYSSEKRSWTEDCTVYQFYNFSGELAEVRTHNVETGLNNKFVVLFKDDKKRINAEGWIELFKSRADLMTKHIEQRLPYTNPVAILEASSEEDRLEEEIRKLTELKSNVMPHFLRK